MPFNGMMVTSGRLNRSRRIFVTIADGRAGVKNFDPGTLVRCFDGIGELTGSMQQ